MIFSTSLIEYQMKAPQIQNLTILAFWFTLVYRMQVHLNRKRLFSIAFITFLSLPFFLFAAVKQVRVIAERASIHIEANRKSTKIEIVEKGMILNLLQQSKVKGVWYYVSFTSPRYGSKISGFIPDSEVELVGEESRPPVKEEQAQPAKAQPALPQEKPAPPQELAPQPKAEEKKEVKVVPKPVVAVEEAIILTSLPKVKSFKLPRSEAERQEMTWKPPVIAEEKEEKKEEIIAEKPARMPAIPQEKPPQPPEVKKEEPKIEETKKEPQVLPPLRPKTPSAVPSKTIRREYVPKKRSAITFGFGYGPSMGGAGGFLQLNTRAGISAHAGVGYYPTTLIYSETDWVKNDILWSAGLKYYLPTRSSSFFPYIDLQYGGLRKEAAQIAIKIGDILYVLSHEQRVLFGPTFLAGAELRRGHFGLNAAGGVSYSMTKWDILKQHLFFAFDLSLVVYF